MERIAHLIAPVASLILGIGWLVPAGVETRAAAPEPAIAAPLLSQPSLPAVRVRGGDGTDRDLAGWAVGRFSEAGLDLPEVTITFHDDDAPCRGNTGLYRPGPPAEVHLCISDGRPETVKKLITLHELGHAWAEAHVDGLGWVGFDCANGICPDERYVRIACGRDYADAAPISGIRFGTASESLSVGLCVAQ